MYNYNNILYIILIIYKYNPLGSSDLVLQQFQWWSMAEMLSQHIHEIFIYLYILCIQLYYYCYNLIVNILFFLFGMYTMFHTFTTGSKLVTVQL